MAPTWPLVKSGAVFLGAGAPKGGGFLLMRPPIPLAPSDSQLRGTDGAGVAHRELQRRAMRLSLSDTPQPMPRRSWGVDATGEGESGVRLPEIDVSELEMKPEDRAKLWRRIADVERELAVALSALEPVAAAARAERLRQQLQELRRNDPYVLLREGMEAAVARGELAQAAKLKLQMDRVGPPPTETSPAASATESSNDVPVSGNSGGKVTYSTRSVAVTNGVRVEVRSQFFPEQSSPAQQHFVFVYRVKITNESRQTVQLISRKWEISTAGGGQPPQVVKGPGVVGQQPVLEPGESFEYSSMCPLSTSPQDGARVLGRMQGTYMMASGPIGEKMFEAKINPFYMILPQEVADRQAPS